MRVVGCERGYLVDAVEDALAAFDAGGNHLVGSGGGASDAQYRIAMGDEPDGDGVEDLVESIVADTGGACSFDEREGVPLAQDGEVSTAVELQGGVGHGFDVVGNFVGIVACAGAVGTGDEDHEAVRH